MEQFDLQEYLDNPNRKIITRKGNSVRIICTNRICTYLDEDYPVVGLVRNRFDGSEMVAGFKSNGESTNKNLDLFFVPEKKEGWINIYEFNSVTVPGTKVYDTEENAKFEIGNKFENYISTIKIEWEE